MQQSSGAHPGYTATGMIACGLALLLTCHVPNEIAVGHLGGLGWKTGNKAPLPRQKKSARLEDF